MLTTLAFLDVTRALDRVFHKYDAIGGFLSIRKIRKNDGTLLPRKGSHKAASYDT